MDTQQTTQSDQSTPPENKKNGNINTLSIVITIAAIILVVLLARSGTKQDALTNRNNEVDLSKNITFEVVSVRADDHVEGDTEKATVIVFEYSDSDCPFCAQFHQTVKKTLDEYEGTVAWVYRYFPLTSLHPNAYTEALALECSATLGGNNAFVKYLDTIIGATFTPDTKGRESLITFAKAQNLDEEMFKKCLLDEKTMSRVERDTTEAKSIGARGTPFNIIINKSTGEKLIIPGAYPFEEMKKAIDSLLK